jgi:hypothetical protein
MTTKYKVEIETSTDAGHTETEFETHDWNELQRFLDLAGVAAQQAPETVEDYSDGYDAEMADPYADDEYMDEDHLEPVTYDFTDEQPADYYETPTDEYDMIDYSELDPYSDENVYENEGRGPSPEKTADQLVRSAGSVEDAVKEAYDTYKHTKNKHWLAVAEYLKNMQKVNEEDDHGGFVIVWPQPNVDSDESEVSYYAGAPNGNAVWYDDPSTAKVFPNMQNARKALSQLSRRARTMAEIHKKSDLHEDDEDRDDAAFDYGNREVRRQKGRASKGRQIDAFDYKGREEAGMQRGTPTQYGNNPMQSLRSSNDDLDESDELDENCGCGPDCGCPACQEQYGEVDTVYVDTGIEPDCGCDEEGDDLPYGYETDSMGNVVIFNNDEGCSVFLTGEDALEVLTALEQNVEDPRTQQVVMRQYGHMMEDHELTVQRQLRETYKQMVRNLGK